MFISRRMDNSGVLIERNTIHITYSSKKNCNYINRLISTMLNEKKQVMEGYEKNSIYISFKAWKIMLYGVYAYIVLL